MKVLVFAVVLAIATASASAFSIQQPPPTPEPENECLIAGLVRRPAVYTWRGDLTVREAIEKAGGRAPGADPVAVFFLMARDKKNDPDEKRVPARLDDRVKPGDVLFVPAAQP